MNVPLKVLLIFFVFVPTADAQPKTFTFLSNADKVSNLSHGGDGTTFQAIHPNGDTVTIYIQRVNVGTPPDFRRADADSVDIAVWSYPDKYPHKKHIFEDAHGILYSCQRKHGKIMFFTGDHAERYEFNTCLSNS